MKIIKVPMRILINQNQLLYGGNINVYRKIADLRDGLLPVERRFIYANYKHTEYKKYVKMENRVTVTLYYHPHSSGAVYEGIGKSGEEWLYNATLLDTSGTSSNAKNTAKGAARYLDSRLSDFTIDCYINHYEDSNVETKLNHTGSAIEPEYLPAKYPVVLFNPHVFGVGQGVCSSIPSFNITEVLRTTINLIKDSDYKVNLCPDFPNGCDIIYDKEKMKSINNTGVGSVQMRASYEIDYNNNIITLTSLPYDTKADKVISDIVDTIKGGKKLQFITNIEDYTKTEIYTKIYILAEYNPETAIEELFKANVGLVATMSTKLILVDNYKLKLYSIKSLLLSWIDFRKEVLVNYYNGKFIKLDEEEQFNEAIIIATDGKNSDKTIKIVKNSNRSEIVDELMKNYPVSSVQAVKIAQMSLSSFSKDAHQEYLQKREEIKKDKEYIYNILSNEYEIEQIIISELEDGIKKYGGPRKSKLINPNNKQINICMWDIVVSKDGYVKKIKPDSIIGTVGKSNTGYKVYRCYDSDNIVIVESIGISHKIKVIDIPESNVDIEGYPIGRYCPLVSNIIDIFLFTDADLKNDNLYLLLVTKNTTYKKIPLSDINKSIKKIITLSDDDTVLYCGLSNDLEKELIVLYTKNGYGLSVPIDDIGSSKCSSKGRNKFLKELSIDNATIIKRSKYILYVTSYGRLKLTKLSAFPILGEGHSIKDGLLKITSFDIDNDELLSIYGVDKPKKTTLVTFSKKNNPQETPVSEVPILNRQQCGDKMISVKNKDIIVDSTLIN